MLTETRTNHLPDPADMFKGNSIIIEAFELYDQVRANQSFASNNAGDIDLRERELAKRFMNRFGNDLRILISLRKKISQHPLGALVNYSITHAASRLS